MLRIRTLLVSAFSLLLIAGSAQAANINDSYDLGKVSIGQSESDLVTLKFNGGTGSDVTTGYLPADSEITFTYTIVPTSAKFTSFSKSAVLSSSGKYDYIKGGYEYKGHASADSYGNETRVGKVTHHNNTSASTPLVLASANISSTLVGTTTIVNDSSSTAYFLSELDTLTKLYGKVIVSYVVSAVPLPAALPLFAVALAVMFGLSRRKARLEGPFA